MTIIETARLILQHWRADEAVSLRLINQDPQVMEPLPMWIYGTDENHSTSLFSSQVFG